MRKTFDIPTGVSSIHFESLTVTYPRRSIPAIDNVSFQAAPGMITAVVGPNGSGKSTLVRALLRRIAVQHGRIVVGDDDVAMLHPRALARRVAIVPQREEPLMSLSVSDFVALGRHAHRGAFGAMSRGDSRAVASALTRAGVEDMHDRRINELSGGEWQRTRIARALAQDTTILVLDEPTTFLDIAHEMAVFELLDLLAREGSTVLLISHQLNLVARFASHIVLLDHGRVAAAGSAADVMRGAVLEQVYRWPLVVTRDAAVGSLALLPLRSRDTRTRGDGARS